MGKRSIMFSSISVWMGQGGSGPTTGASGLMDAIALVERQQQLMNMSVTVLWGAIGEIGHLRFQRRVRAVRLGTEVDRPCGHAVPGKTDHDLQRCPRVHRYGLPRSDVE